MTPDDLALMILLIGEASGVFAGFCPSWFTVSSPFFHEQDAKAGNVRRIREGEAAATAIVMATGWAVSRTTGKPFGLIASGAISAVFIAGYERAIRKPSIDDQANSADGLDVHHLAVTRRLNGTG